MWPCGIAVTDKDEASSTDIGLMVLEIRALLCHVDGKLLPSN